jgi:TRAP-type C4-dicarboxylate transport system permease small subunit
MVLLSFTQVILRNVFSSGFMWADILLRHLVLWIGFLGAALATSAERHISIDAFTRLLSARWKHLARIVTNFFALVICAFLAKASVTFVLSEMESQTELFSGVMTWHAQMIIPVGYVLLMLHFIVRTIITLDEMVNVKPR